MANPNNNTKGFPSDESPKKKLAGKAESEVRENEDASLQDDSYAFDSDNTGNEDIHDISDFDEMISEEDDYLQ